MAVIFPVSTNALVRVAKVLQAGEARAIQWLQLLSRLLNAVPLHARGNVEVNLHLSNRFDRLKWLM